MNGAELPCGSIIRVEPADSNYHGSSNLQHKQRATLLDESSSTDANTEKMMKDDNALNISDDVLHKAKDTATTVNQTNEVTDDLDDFFDSL